MHRLSLTWLAALVVALGLGGCTERQPLRVAVHPWIGYEALCLADDLDWLPPDITLQHGQRAADSLAALRAGTVDAAALTLDEALQARAGGLPLTVVLVLDSSAGADMVLARPDIERLTDLAGKRVGYDPTAVGALVLSELLAQARLPESAITPVELPLTQQLAAWRDGAVDAVVTYEPIAAELLAAGATRLFDSRQMPDTIFDVLVVRRDRIEGRHASLRRLVESHFRALEHLRRNREDAVHRIAAHQGVAAADVRRALGGVMLPDASGNRYALQPGSRFDQTARRLERLMVQRRLLKDDDDLNGLFDANFLPAGDAAP